MTSFRTDHTTTTPPNSAARTELEAGLASPQGGLIRAAGLVRLHALAANIDTQLNIGANRSDYEIGRALARAVTAASEILERHPAAGDTPGSLPTPAGPHPSGSSFTAKR